jgi:pimeloyl-ACP methyl ester carboxylesterase
MISLRTHLIALLWLSASVVLVSCESDQPKVPGKEFAELDYPYPTQTVTVMDSIDVAYVDQGAGEQTVLLIHGLGSYLPAWKRTIEDLKTDYRVIALDLPGYGKSSKGDYSYTMPFFANVVDRFMDQLKLQGIPVAGHSMGGQIAMRLSLDHPDRVSKLMLISPAGIEAFTKEDRAFFAKYVTPESIMSGDRSDITDNIERNFHEMPKSAEFMITDRLAVKGAQDFEAYAKANVQSVLGMLDGPVRSELDQLKQSTLIVFGENDALIPNTYLHDGTTEEVANEAQELIPNSRMVMIPKAGHFVHFEQAEQVNQELTRFLAQ